MAGSFSALNVGLQNIDDLHVYTNILLAHLVFKNLVKVAGWLWHKVDKLSAGESEKHVTWVRRLPGFPVRSYWPMTCHSYKRYFRARSTSFSLSQICVRTWSWILSRKPNGSNYNQAGPLTYWRATLDCSENSLNVCSNSRMLGLPSFQCALTWSYSIGLKLLMRRAVLASMLQVCAIWSFSEIAKNAQIPTPLYTQQDSSCRGWSCSKKALVNGHRHEETAHQTRLVCALDANP